MSDKPEAMQGFGPQWPGPGANQFFPTPFFHPFFFPFPFLFRIHPRFFIGFLPRRHRRRFGMEAEEEEMGMCIRCISEPEYASMMRMGFPEVEVVSE